MADRPLDGDYVAERLAEAGMTLLALHVGGMRPAGFRSFWPAVEGAEADGRWEAAPSPRRISEMDQALGWIGLIPEDQVGLRRLVGARTLCRRHWEDGRPEPIFSWKTLGEQMGCSDGAAKRRWEKGIALIVRRLSEPGFCQAPQFRGTARLAPGSARRSAGRLVFPAKVAETA